MTKTLDEKYPSFHQTAQFCPVCFKVLDGVTALTGGVAPVRGDFTICLYCRSVLRYGEGMQLDKSSLLEVPEHSRLYFVKVLRLMDELPPPKGKIREGKA